MHHQHIGGITAAPIHATAAVIAHNAVVIVDIPPSRTPPQTLRRHLSVEIGEGVAVQNRQCLR